MVESVPPPLGLAYSVRHSRQQTGSSAASLGEEAGIFLEIRKERESCGYVSSSFSTRRPAIFVPTRPSTVRYATFTI